MRSGFGSRYGDGASGRCRVVLASCLCLVWTAACAGPIDRTLPDRALEEINTAKNSGLVAEDSIDLQEAARHLQESFRLISEGGGQELIDHEAELSQLYARVAVVRAEAVAAIADSEAYIERARSSTATTRMAVEVAIQNARNIDAEQTERGLVLTLGGVLFELNSAKLTQEATLLAARVAGFLIALENRDALVEGHADSTGRSEYNQELSLRRAQSISEALAEFGVTENRLLAVGYGDQFPVASNDTAEGRERNRRVEIVILTQGASAQASRRSR